MPKTVFIARGCIAVPRTARIARPALNANGEAKLVPDVPLIAPTVPSPSTKNFSVSLPP